MENSALADDLQREFDALADRRSFGLNFERHVPEAVELPGRKVRKGDKVRVLPARGEARTAENDRLWRVIAFATEDGIRRATVVSLDEAEQEASVAVDDLVVVAEFRDPIYPGLVSTGTVERGGDKPFHAVINAENFHALQTLLFTHRGKVDCIYIDPPYNTGAKDWKYNNDYVEGDDVYRHSKWLAMMERRLSLAKEILNPDDSVLIVTIDEKEYLRLGLLLEQTFPEARIQMVSSVISPGGTGRKGEFSRNDEYLFFVMIGGFTIHAEPQDGTANRAVTWSAFQRSDIQSARLTRPAQFYPLYVNPDTRRIEHIGEALTPDQKVGDAPDLPGLVKVFPIRPDGTEMNWGLTASSFAVRVEKRYVKVGKRRFDVPQPFPIYYLKAGPVSDIESGRAVVTGHGPTGEVLAQYVDSYSKMPTTNWSRPSHNARAWGTDLLRALMPDRRFPFPKSLYAVEDALRFFLKEKTEAVVVDFFAGSGTTAHAVMRLNHQDGGRRMCICVTNNEVSTDEQKALRRQGLRPGDPGWEMLGICDHITVPRLTAATTGQNPVGKPIKGDYKFIDEFPMADGLEENVEFFTLTYEAPLRVASNREFAKIAPLLWLRAGSCGRRIDDMSNGWDVADVYGVVADLDQSEAFLKALAANDEVAMAFIVTDEDRLFEALVAELPDRVEPVRLYEAYLRNFEIEAGRGTR